MGILDNIFKKPEISSDKVYYTKGPKQSSELKPAQEKHIIFDIAGIYYYKDNLHKAGTINRKYYLKDEDLIGLGRKSIYRFRYDKPLTLEEEPTNKHDKNAIKILVGGFHVGYVPAEFCAKVKQIIKNNAITDIKYNINGGEYKSIEDGNVFEEEADYNTSVTITYMG